MNKGNDLTLRGLWLCFALVSAGASCAADLPDPRITPGALNPEVTQANLHETVCVKGYTKKNRPPAYFTNKLKKAQIKQYGYLNTDPRDYEEDHLIALSIGGAARDPLNLWPAPRKTEWGAERKNQLEFVLYRLVCAGDVPLAEAQRAMATNWIEAWRRYVPSHLQEKYRSVD